MFSGDVDDSSTWRAWVKQYGLKLCCAMLLSVGIISVKKCPRSWYAMPCSLNTIIGEWVDLPNWCARDVAMARELSVGNRISSETVLVKLRKSGSRNN